MAIHEALAPPFDAEALVHEVPELRLALDQGQGPFHHLDVFEHILETIRGVEKELLEGRVGVRVGEEGREGLRVVRLLHDIAKPVTRGEVEGRVLFVAHDALGARLAHKVCRRLGLPARTTDLVTTLTALHLNIGFMGNPARTTRRRGSRSPRDRSGRSSPPFLGPIASPPRARA
ncbi:MAG: HD domain-containing protein [Actinomycetota bacterium]|nr:HD domain-containing protein [Actinomycetota bacterium]